MFDNNFHYISIIVIRGEPVVSFTKLDLPKLFRNMITFNDCRMAVSLYVLINDQNIAILRRKSLTTDIIDRLYKNKTQYYFQTNHFRFDSISNLDWAMQVISHEI